MSTRDFHIEVIDLRLRAAHSVQELARPWRRLLVTTVMSNWWPKALAWRALFSSTAAAGQGTTRSNLYSMDLPVGVSHLQGWGRSMRALYAWEGAEWGLLWTWCGWARRTWWDRVGRYCVAASWTALRVITIVGWGHSWMMCHRSVCGWLHRGQGLPWAAALKSRGAYVGCAPAS